MHPRSYPLTECKDSSSCLLQLWPKCPARLWKVKGMGGFNPIDVEISSKGGRGYTKISPNPGTRREVARPRKSIPTMQSESHSVVSNFCGSKDDTVHGILQTRILGWEAFPFFWGSSQPRDHTHVSHIAGRLFSNWAVRKAHSNYLSTKRKK